MAKKDFKDAFLNIENEEEKLDTSLETNEQSKAEIIETEMVKQEKTPKVEKVKTEEKTSIVKNGQTNEVTVLTTTEIQITESLNEQIQKELLEVEKKIKEMKYVGFGKKEKISFDDMYGGKTISMNRILKPLFEKICNSSNMTRAEITEMILINGIKHTNFDRPNNEG